MFTKSARLAIASVLTIVTAAFVSLMPHIATAQDVNPGDFVLRYDSSDGNLTVHYLGTTPVDIYFIDILTLGDGTYGTATSDSLGLLSRTVVANSYGNNDILNNSAGGVNGQYSQVFYAQDFTFTNPVRTFDSTNNTLDIGNVGQTGWTQADINATFITDTVTYENLNPGHFGYSTLNNDFIGTIELTPVPEPSTLILATGGVVLCGVHQLRRRKTTKHA